MATRGQKRNMRRLAYGVALATATIALASVTGLAAAVEYIGGRAPLAALSISKDDPNALVRAADLQLQQPQNLPKSKELRAAGSTVLRGRPLSAGGVRMIAVAAQMDGNGHRAEQLLDLSSKISRRDFGTQLMLIETAVQGGDVRKALTHYDVALQTNKSADNILFPILAGAIEDPAVRSEFRAFIKTGHPWIGSFLGYAIRAGGHSRTVATVIDEAGGLAHLEGREDIKSALLQGLATERHFSELTHIYSTMDGAKRDILTQSAFNQETTRQNLVPLAWHLTVAPPLSSGFQKADRNVKGLELQVSLEAGEEFIVARKLLYLRPGSYRFRAGIDSSTWLTDSNVRWILKCALTTYEPAIWTGRFPDGGGSKAVAGTFATTCPVQYLDLVAGAGAGQSTLDFVAHSPDIQPVTADAARR